MNSKLYKQADSRWGSKPYPSGSTMSGCGCGCVACTHVVIEQEKYKNYTPENLRPWMVSQGFAIRGQGTTWNGITKTLQHYGYKVTHIGVNDPMSKAWTELDKGNRIGVILFKGGKAPNGTVWTASGHYVAFTDYKKQNGLHYFYTKDSGGRNHDSAKYGYYSYEKSMKGLVYQMWIVQRVGAEVKTTSTTTSTKTTTTTSNSTLAVDGKFGPASVKALQKVLGTTQDGKITGQTSTLKKYHTGFSGGIAYGKGGSACVKALQKMLKLSGPDGQLGPNTIKAFQKYLGMSGPDGYWGPNTSKAVQKWLNTKLNPTPTSTPPKTTTTTPTTTTTTTTPTTTSTSTAKSEEIIDVSYVQSKTIDWAKVKAAGIAGAIVRCGYRGYGSGSLNEDSMFMNHVQGAYKAGLKIGIYFFTEAINEAEGREEARFAIKMLQKSGVKLTYPIAIDTENINASNPTPRANSGKLSTANRTAAIKGFCDEIKKNGYEPMIYASTSWLNNQLNMSQLPYKVWVAQYNTKVTYGGSYIIWQYTSTAKINGIDGVVDKNHSYYALGNTTSTAPKTTTTSTSASTSTLKSTSIIAQEVLDGKWGSGEERKKKLQAAGYNYDVIQSEVNKLLVAGKSVEAIAIEVINGLWGSGDFRKNALIKAGYDYNAIQNKVNEFIKTMRSRKEAMKPWFDACKTQEQWSYNAVYNWGKWSPKNIAQSKYYGTCITYPNVVAMRCKMIQEGNYITSTGSEHDDLNTRNAFWNRSIKAINSINPKYWRTVKYPNKSLKELVDTGVVLPGDIIGFMGHTTMYAGKDSKGNLTFNNAGHAAGIYGDKPGSNRPVLNQKNSSYANRTVYGVFSINTFGVITSCIGGTITPTNLYMAGQDVKITVTPSTGNTITSIKVDGKSINNISTYTISKIDANHKIEVICEKTQNSQPIISNKKSIDEIAKEVIAGKWDSGNARKQKLTAAGYDYDAVQKKVNEILGSSTNSLVDKMNAWAKKMAAEKYHYVRWSESDAKTHTCPICKGRKYDDHYGWNCIGWAFAIWHHGGGINCNCNCHVVADAKRILNAATDQAAYDEAVKRVGIKNIEVIRNNGKSIKDKLKGGDICWTMSGGEIKHTYYYMGNGKYSDSTSGRSDNIKADITASSTLLNNTVLAIRYKNSTTTTTTTNTTTTTAKQSYSGILPSMKLVKTNAEAIADAIRWAIWIAGDNSFHYGYTSSDKTIDAHHNGCYWCGTNVTSGGRSKKGIVDYEKSYCCNPFVGAAWAHGGCVPKAMELCQKGTSWDFSKGHGYDASSLFTKLGHPVKSSLKAGDVLCKDTHVALYVGNGKIAEAGSGDDNVRNSTKWNNSIRVTTLTDANYKNFQRVYRFNSSVDTTIALYPGEISERVKLLQKYLNWYFGSQVCSVDGYFGDGTRKYVKAFQTARKITVDGIVGPATIAEMGKVQK